MLLSDASTSALAVSALDTLVAMHLLLTINVAIMARAYSVLTVVIRRRWRAPLNAHVLAMVRPSWP